MNNGQNVVTPIVERFYKREVLPNFFGHTHLLQALKSALEKQIGAWGLTHLTVPCTVQITEPCDLTGSKEQAAELWGCCSRIG